MIHLGKRAALSDALVVLRGVMAYDLRLFHLNAEMLPYKVNGRKDGEEGIPLAAAWTSDLTDRLKRFAVILWDSANGSLVRGVDFEMMDTNIPVLIPAPQAPQKPQAPPGTLRPRFIISVNALRRSMSPPALWYAVSNAAPTIT